MSGDSLLLSFAVSNDNKEVVDALLDKGADIYSGSNSYTLHEGGNGGPVVGYTGDDTLLD